MERPQTGKEYMLSNNKKDWYILPLRSYFPMTDIYRAYINKWDQFYTTFSYIKKLNEISVDDNIVNKEDATVKQFYKDYLDEKVLNHIFPDN